MKRNWPIERVLAWKRHYWGEAYLTLKDVIPPRSVIRLTKREDDWDDELQLGDEFRVGYYGRRDGPDCVWLVDANANYFHTWDQSSLLDHFEVVERSDEQDTFGNHRPHIEAIP